MYRLGHLVDGEWIAHSHAPSLRLETALLRAFLVATQLSLSGWSSV